MWRWAGWHSVSVCANTYLARKSRSFIVAVFLIVATTRAASKTMGRRLRAFWLTSWQVAWWVGSCCYVSLCFGYLQFSVHDVAYWISKLPRFKEIVPHDEAMHWLNLLAYCPVAPSTSILGREGELHGLGRTKNQCRLLAMCSLLDLYAGARAVHQWS